MVFSENGKTLNVMYDIRTEGKFDKQYGRLDENMTRRANQAIEILKNRPFVGQKLSGKFAGLRKIEIGSYRLVYEVDSGEKACYLQSILPRKDAYKRGRRIS